MVATLLGGCRDAPDAPAGASAQTIALPAPGQPPPGLDAALWREVGWFPAPVVVLSEFTRPESASLIQWLAGATSDDPSCERSLYAVDHYFAVAQRDAEPLPTHVVVGTTQRSDVHACIQSLAGSRMRVDGGLTAIESSRGTMWLGFGSRGDQTVVVAHSDEIRVRAFMSGTKPLPHDSRIVHGLGHVDRTADTWSVATGDAAVTLFGLAAQVHAFSIHGLTAGEASSTRLSAWADFGSHAKAEAAKTALDALVGDYQSREKVDLGYQVAPTTRGEVRLTASMSTLAPAVELVGYATTPP